MSDTTTSLLNNTELDTHINPTHATSFMDIPMVTLDSLEDANLGEQFALRQIQLPDDQVGITNASITVEQEAESSRAAKLRTGL